MTDYAKIAGPRATFISDDEARELLSAESGTRPRMYGYWQGQIVALNSTYHLDRYTCERIWLSGTTLADLVSRA